MYKIISQLTYLTKSALNIHEGVQDYIYSKFLSIACVVWHFIKIYRLLFPITFHR